MDEPARTVEGFLDDLLNFDVPALRNRLHRRVHLRALEPGATLGHSGAAAVAADRVRQLACWDDVRVLHRHSWQFAGRFGLDLRLQVCRGQDLWECEQRIYLDFDDGLIHRIDVLSSGCHRISRETDPTPHGQGERP
jgi:hypothetical protein